MGEKTKETKEICTNFAENWSVVGYRYVYLEHGIRKLIWLILLVAAAAFSVYLFLGAIEDYVKRETYNVDSANYDVPSLDFPSVTICNINALNLKKAQAAGFVKSSREFVKNYSGLIGSRSIGFGSKRNGELPDIPVEWFLKNNISSARQAYNVFQSNYEDMTENDVIRKVRPIGACRFNSAPCNRSDITTSLSWGKTTLCQEYNSYTAGKSSKTLADADIDAGLKMVFHIDSDNLMITDHDFVGLELLLHPYGTPHFIMEYTERVYLQAGTMNIITVEPKKVYNLPSPFSTKCVESAPYHVISGNYPYSKAMCEVDCVLEKILTKCGCVGFEMEQLVNSSISICSITQMKCYLTYKETYKRKRANTCKKTCNLGCVETKYNIRTEQVTIGNNDIYKRLSNIKGWKKNNTKQESAFFIQENIVGVIIGFNAIIETTSTITQSVTWVELLGQIGGNFGLCTGFCILTLFEFFFFVFDMVWSFSRKVGGQVNAKSVVLERSNPVKTYGTKD